MPSSYLINRMLFKPQIEASPSVNLGIVVVIPCYNEPDLLLSLESLLQAKQGAKAIEIIVLINDSETSDVSIKKQNATSYAAAKEWSKKHSSIQKQFHIIYQKDLPPKKAGVGMARKIGMDEAAFRLEAVECSEGIILGFDADSKCQSNYFIAIEDHFKKYPSIQAASLWYEHPLGGDAFEERTYQAIAEYELHLRYFTLAKRFAGYPHAFETIGSSMAVRAAAYQQQGGMNTRKAGEDFYFLNKFMVLGKLNELNETVVIPSPRTSDRVPFGTGKAVGELLLKQEDLTTYAFQSFIDLKAFVQGVPQFFEKQPIEFTSFPPAIQGFLNSIDAAKTIEEIRSNTSSKDAFEKRFFRWFDPFMVMKYVHYARDHFYPNISVKTAGEWLLENYFDHPVNGKSEREMLKLIRELWKSKGG